MCRFDNDLVKRILIFSLIFFVIGCNHRNKDIDELVLDDYISEKNGIYYFCDCEIHCNEKKITRSGKNYYYNLKIKNTWKLINGKPDSTWVYFDTLGNKKMEILFNDGEVKNKIKY